MRILVTFAVEAEFAPWRKLREFKRISASPLPSNFVSSFRTDIEHQLFVLLTGIGEAGTQASLKQSGFLEQVKPDCMISSGLAGALKESFLPGVVVVPTNVRTLNNHANVDSDYELREEAIQLGAVPIDNLITVDRLVKTAEEKARLSCFGEAIDMESAIVMSRFAGVGVPSMALRAISDGSSEDLPLDFDRCFTPQGAIKPMSLVRQVVRRPDNLPSLIRFGRQSYRAAQMLAEFLEKFVLALPVGAEKAAKA
jgi:nucleoside phosphorylase